MRSTWMWATADGATCGGFGAAEVHAVHAGGLLQQGMSEESVEVRSQTRVRKAAREQPWGAVDVAAAGFARGTAA